MSKANRAAASFGLLLTLSLVFVLTCCFSAPAQLSSQDPQAASLPGRITVRGVVRMPDGTPATDCRVFYRLSRIAAQTDHVTTNAQGEFTIPAIPRLGIIISVATADHQWMAQMQIGESDLRSGTPKPLAFTLAPSLAVPVETRADGKPVGDVKIAFGSGFTHDPITTDAMGRATLHFSNLASSVVSVVSAWHAEKGIAGTYFLPGEMPSEGEPLRLELHKGAPRTIKVVDDAGQPVPNVPLQTSVGFGEQLPKRIWFESEKLAKAALTSDEHGEITCNWIPATAWAVNFRSLSNDWYANGVDFRPNDDSPIVVHLARVTTARGRVRMPEGQSAEGLAVHAYGYGTMSTSHIAQTYCQSDGTFDLPVVANRGYCISVVDLDWATDTWTGLVKSRPDDKPAKIELAAYPAARVEVLTTSGKDKSPTPGCWISACANGSFDWVTLTGERRGGILAINHDAGLAAGRHVLGLGRGEFEIRLTCGDWRETQTIRINNAEPQQVTFHRPWVGKRVIAASIQHNGLPYDLEDGVRSLAWSDDEGHTSETVAGVPFGRATLRFAFDAGHVSLSVLDSKYKLSGTARMQPDDVDPVIEMLPAASYSGTVEIAGAPAANFEVRLLGTRNMNSRPSAVNVELALCPDAVTDADGQFQFEAVPVNVPLGIAVRPVGGAWEHAFLEMRYFLSGEDRTEDVIRVNPPAAVPKPVSVEQRINSLTRDAALNHLSALFVLQGDAASAGLVKRLLDSRESPESLHYLVMPLQPADLANVNFAKREWVRPGEGQLALVTVDQRGQISGQVSFQANDELAYENAMVFIRERMPEPRSSREQIRQTSAEAARSGRNVWIVLGGSRCGPCVLLARWMDDHRELLERDYVIVKLVEPVDDEVSEIYAELSEAARGIPWMAILAPDGSKLATGDSPLGNIAFPSSTEGIRHLRKMLEASRSRLTDADLDQLTKSLEKR